MQSTGGFTMLKSLLEYKDYIIANAIGELKFRYAGSSMGFFWNILNPLFQILVYTYVFSNIMKAKLNSLESTGSFSLYLCAGMFAWLAFQECINRGTNTFIENSSFLKKLPVPEIVFLAQKALSTFFSCVINYVLIFVYGIIILKSISIYWVLVPIILILFILFSFGVSIFLSTLNVFFRDTVQIVGVLMMIWMWITPIVYVREILPDNFVGLLNFNVAVPYINALQQIIVFGKVPPALDFFKMFIITALSIVIGYIFLKKYEQEIRDQI